MKCAEVTRSRSPCSSGSVIKNEAGTARPRRPRSLRTGQRGALTTCHWQYPFVFPLRACRAASWPEPRRFAKTIQWPLRAGGGGAEAGWGDTSRSPGRVCPERLEQPRPPRSGSARWHEHWLCRSETRNASGVRARPPSPPNCPLWDEACPRARHTGRTPSRAVPARQAVLRDGLLHVPMS